MWYFYPVKYIFSAGKGPTAVGVYVKKREGGTSSTSTVSLKPSAGCDGSGFYILEAPGIRRIYSERRVVSQHLFT